MRFFMPIQKVEEQADGTLLVAGIASTESVDADGEIIQAEAIKNALPDFFRYGTGALREMHQSLAAGTVDEADVANGVTFISTTVVDPVAITKVKTGTYKGFSIGGNITARDPNDRKIITGLKLVEVSLVDRPANPDAVIQMFKAEVAEESEVSKADLPNADKQAVEEIAQMLNKGLISASTLLKAAQDVVSPSSSTEPPAAAEPVKLTGDALKKGMYGIQQFAQVLTEVRWLASDAAIEAQMEGDSSAVPAQLRDWLSQGVSIFAAMTAEETAELLASVAPPATEAVEVIAASEAVTDLQKAGAKFSTATKSVLADIHKAILDCCAKMDGLGYKDAEDGDDEDVAAAAAARDTKAESVAQDSTTEVLSKALAERDVALAEMAKRLEKLEAQPLPGKALLKAVTVGKSEDTITPATIVDAAVVTDDPLILMKAVHARGGVKVGVPLS